MIEPKSIRENIFFTTVRIEVSLLDGSLSVGTGFIYSHVEDEKKYPFVVTNKHVVKNSIKGKMIFNLADGNKPILGNIYTIEYPGPDFESVWIGHPDEDIDVAIMPFGPVLEELSKKGIQIFFKSITPSLIPTDEDTREKIDAIEDIIFIGYPNNIYDRKNMIPVARKGITATPASIDYEGTPAFLIDASIFPGSSGSPVFICNTGSYSDKSGCMIGSSRLYFMGILASVFTRSEINKIEPVNIPTTKIPAVRTTQMIDLGIVYKSTTIKKLIEDFLKSLKDKDLTVGEFKKLMGQNTANP